LTTAEASPRTRFDSPPVERVEAMRDVITRGGDEAQQIRRLPEWLADALIEAGWRESRAGALVALLNVIAIPGVVLVSLLGGRVIGLRPYLVMAATGLVVGTVGLASTGGGGTAWGWVAVISLSLGSLFALAMTLSAAATDRPGEAAALASMQLGVGYTMAAAAPFALGALRDGTGSFTAGLWVVAGISVLVAVFAATTIVLLGRRPTRVAQPPEEAAST